MTPSRIFLYFCLSFVGGIFLNSLISVSQIFIFGISVFGLVLIAVFWKYGKLKVLGFCVLFIVLGIWRHQTGLEQILGSQLQKYNDSDEKVILIGFVAKEPDVRPSSVKLTVISKQLTVNNKQLTISGKILVTANRYPEYEYGQELEITGKLKTPSEDIEGFNYKEYLLKDGVVSLMDWPRIEQTGKNQGNLFFKYLLSFKNKLKENVSRVMAPPQSALLEALFFGDEENFSQEWRDKFNITGTRHITAVSGMNITIICFLILNFLLFLGFWRKQAFYISVVLIVLYILMIGAPASAVRAGIMGLIFIAGQYFGRVSAANRAVIFASVIMLALNPLILKLDIGFQLSFLAVIGLIYLQPALLEAFKKVPDIFQLRYALSATLAAQVFTLPILIYNFGQISLVSPIINVLVVPLLSLITILGFIFAFAGILIPVLGQILSWPVWLLLSYITGLIDKFSELSFAVLRIEGVHWLLLLSSYLLLGFIAWKLKEKQKLKFLAY